MDIARPALTFFTRLKWRRADPRGMRASLLSLLALVSLFAVLSVALSVYAFTYRAEQEFWRGRQGEAARNAALQVASIFRHADDSLTLVGGQVAANSKLYPHILYDYVRENADLIEVARLDRSGIVVADSSKADAVLNNFDAVPVSQWFLQARSGKNYYGTLVDPASSQL